MRLRFGTECVCVARSGGPNSIYIDARRCRTHSAPLSSIRGGNAEENAEIIRSVLRGKRGPHFDTVVFNAGIGFLQTGKRERFRRRC